MTDLIRMWRGGGIRRFVSALGVQFSSMDNGEQYTKYKDLRVVQSNKPVWAHSNAPE